MSRTRSASSTRHAGGARRFLRSSARGPVPAAAASAVLRSLRQHVDHVDRNANRAGLIGNGPGDRLANPPRGVRART